ncbi:NAD regulator [Terrihabitans soli]|uniref:NAD regulator n=1 Tax=Terrihabitans soli TaxID=708113 RepID=A0A6S6QGD6_9HYPH|nr:NAD regulator [Terrihabitans soli]BCJ90203.1 NAD regulator [Terrihabitans soli]
MLTGSPTQIEINLTAAIVAVEEATPLVLVTKPGKGEPEGQMGLPSGPFDPRNHRTFDMGLRSWVQDQTALGVGYAEQLYTFGDRGRHMHIGDTGPHVVSVGYLALTRQPEDGAGLSDAGAVFEPWYDYFPWEDWREGRPSLLDSFIPVLTEWASEKAPGPIKQSGGRRERLTFAFGHDNGWDEEKVLDRYELLYEAGLVEEAKRDGREAALKRGEQLRLGRIMRFDHRRILATAMGRLRSKLKYRPVVFELMPEEFTLTALQRTVEAISGRHLHKQNFRRLVEAGALVEPTGATSITTGGRPAQLFRFRRDVVAERPAAGLRLGARG